MLLCNWRKSREFKNFDIKKIGALWSKKQILCTHECNKKKKKFNRKSICSTNLNPIGQVESSAAKYRSERWQHYPDDAQSCHRPRNSPDTCPARCCCPDGFRLRMHLSIFTILCAATFLSSCRWIQDCPILPNFHFHVGTSSEFIIFSLHQWPKYLISNERFCA